jgi:hypothetical protein
MDKLEGQVLLVLMKKCKQNLTLSVVLLVNKLHYRVIQEVGT